MNRAKVKSQQTTHVKCPIVRGLVRLPVAGNKNLEWKNYETRWKQLERWVQSDWSTNVLHLFYFLFSPYLFMSSDCNLPTEHLCYLADEI